MSENKIDYNKKRQDYEQKSVNCIVDILKNTGNDEFIDFIVGNQYNFNYTEDREEIENLKGKFNSKKEEFNSCKKLQQQSLRNKEKNTGNENNNIHPTVDSTAEIKAKLKQIQSELKNLEKEIKTKQNIFETKYSYDKLVRNLSVASKKNSKDLPNRIKEKNNNLTEKLIFLLDNNVNGFKDKLIQEKNKALNIQPYTYNDYSVETLSKDNISTALILGALVPCCLSLNESGNKYLLGILFDPDISITLIKDKDGKIIATTLTVYNEQNNTISFVHVDTVREVDIDGKVLKKVLDGYTNSIITNKQHTNVLLLPGEQTLINLGYNVEELEKKLCILIEICNPEQLLSIKNLQKNAKQGHRTGSTVPCLTYVLENPNLFDDIITNFTIDYIKKISNTDVYYSKPKTLLFPDDYEDKFHIADDFGGHSISNIAINLKQQVLNIQNHERLVEFVSQLSNANQNSKFEDYNILRDKRRKCVLNNYEEFSQELTRIFGNQFIKI